MTGHKWREVMNLTYDATADMLRDTKEFGSAYSEDWQRYWNSDWEILTARMKPYMDTAKFITRGRGHSGFAYGRVDRGDSCQIPIGENLIDHHGENNNVKHPEKWNKFISLFESIYGKL